MRSQFTMDKTNNKYKDAAINATQCSGLEITELYRKLYSCCYFYLVFFYMQVTKQHRI